MVIPPLHEDLIVDGEAADDGFGRSLLLKRHQFVGCSVPDYVLLDN
jgi:hypothetical protein